MVSFPTLPFLPAYCRQAACNGTKTILTLLLFTAQPYATLLSDVMCMMSNGPGRKLSSKAVQGTNDSSIVSKLSMSEAGFFLDSFLTHFVAKKARRSPLINRGYYIRVKAMDHVLTKFLAQYPTSTQILSLGAGFDSTYFRLFSQGKLEHCKFIEVDFPSTVDRKLSLINSTPELCAIVQNLSVKADGKVFDSTHYSLVGCDLCRLSELMHLLDVCSISYSLPTLFISECVLTYIDPDSVNNLLSWSAGAFSNTVFCTYEQVHPNDPFGIIMQQHFTSLGSPLRNMSVYPTREDQELRYLQAGWPEVISCDMNQFYSTLPTAEKERVNSLEPFDEYEGWHLKCSHYMLLCALNGSTRTLASSLLPVQKHQRRHDCALAPVQTTVECTPFSRFAHSSVQLESGQIVVVGGFGPSFGAGPHTRLDEVLILDSAGIGEGQWKCTILHTTGGGPGKLIHHTATLVPSLNAILVYGGRASPFHPNPSCYLLRFDGGWAKVDLDATSHMPDPRWRHTATLLGGTGRELVVVIGGISPARTALDDCYVLDTKTWRFSKLDVTLPEGRHSHCALAYHNSVIIIGGLDSAMRPLASCLQLTRGADGESWKMSVVEFEVPLPSRYSMDGCICGDTLWIIGGVQFNNTAGLLKVDLLNKKWMEIEAKSMVGDTPFLLCNHTCHISRDKLIILGGGANCFSFGTHINSLLSSIELTMFLPTGTIALLVLAERAYQYMIQKSVFTC